MAREWLHFADDILSAVKGAEAALQGKSFENFRDDWLLRLAIQRAMEIISEASRRLPETHKAARPDIEWRKIGGIGNVLRHEYFAVSDAIIWETIVKDPPPLKQAIEAMIAKSES